MDAVLTELSSYANYHFRAEEALWQQALGGDVWVGEHHETHQAFLTEVTQLCQDSGNASAALDRLLTFLTHWLVEHILGDDKRLALVVLGLREGLSPQAARLRAQHQMSCASAMLVRMVMTMHQSATIQAMALLHEKHAHQQAQAELHVSEDRWRALLKSAGPARSPLEQTLRVIIDRLPTGLVAAHTFEQHFIFANPWFCRMLGYTLDEVLSMSPADLHPPEALALVQADFAHLQTGAQQASITLPVRRKDGSIFIASIERVPIQLGDQASVMAIFTDITERQRAEQALELERLRLKNAIDAAQAATWEWDLTNDQIELQDDAADLLGYAPDQLQRLPGQTYLSWIYPQDLALQSSAMAAHLRGQTPRFKVELRLRHHDGHWLWCRVLGCVVRRTSDGQASRVAGIAMDISKQKTHQAQLDFVTHHDALTGLPNRRSLVEQLGRAITQVAGQQHLAVAYFDLDGFAAINQSLGEDVGNQLILAISQRLQAATHEPQFLAHVGGDEFVYLFPDLKQRSDYGVVVQHLLDVIAQPLQLTQRTLTVTASVGVTLFAQHQPVDAEQLLRQADQAMYAAKQAGKNRYIQFDQVFDERTRERLLRLEAIRYALQNGQFVLFFQPKVHLATGRVTGFEALIRWQHPQRGLLAPAEFIPLIASTPLAIDVGDWVIGAALAQLACWNAQGLITRVSVNIDAQQLLDPTFADRLERQLVAQPGVQTHQLQVEILETGALGNMALVSSVIRRLQALGIESALDDFGTGYSSLTYLKQLAARTIKIDQSFVLGMLDDVEHAAIVNGVLSLTRNFDRRALAEGIETEAHGRALIEFGCEYGQGYQIARPMPAAEVPGWLAQWQVPQSWGSSKRAPPRDIPVLLAKVEHRAWMRQLRAHLGDPSQPAPVNDSAECRFGKWMLRHNTQRRFQRNPLFGSLRDIHRDLHQQTEPLLARVRVDAQADVSTDLAMLEALSQTMLEQLRTLRLSATESGWNSVES
ncbi:MAG: EAL domain-containing protein [Rhodoferax sp.]|nr:EAL domain-containing protein [Rhodoferax sp.]